MFEIYQKRILAIAGITWFVYLIFHMLANLQFFSGETAFNDFYGWFNSSLFLYLLVSIILLIGLLAHVSIAVLRQVSNHKKRRQGYHKAYPKEIPRVIAWSGATILLTFIIFHVLQVMILNEPTYRTVVNTFQSPLMWGVYGLGLAALTAHLYHALTNVLQTLGVTHKQNRYWVVGILVFLIGGFVSVPITIILF